MAYELFSNKSTKFGSPQITIRSGKIYCNADAGDILLKKQMKFVFLLWDAEENKIAIFPTPDEEESTFALSIPKGRRGATFSAASFLRYIKWTAQEPVTVSAEWDEAAGLLEAVLPKENIGVIAKPAGK